MIIQCSWNLFKWYLYKIIKRKISIFEILKIYIYLIGANNYTCICDLGWNGTLCNNVNNYLTKINID